MGVKCGSQALICEFPVSVDTYKNCSHGCLYCFAQIHGSGFIEVEPLSSTGSVRNFIDGRRTTTTNWCDWRIPLHWGGMSDPFQPAEREHGCSLELLELLVETGYPFMVSTKGRLCAEEPYISLLAKANAVVQISMASPRYDVLEPNAPSFAERLDIVRSLVGADVKRVICRVQPYFPQYKESILESIPLMADAGSYGATFEGYKSLRKCPGMVRSGSDWCFPVGLLERDYAEMRDTCHSVGMSFYCAENRLRTMGDSTACCGCDGLDGFKGNRFNLVALQNGYAEEPSEAQLKKGTATAIRGAIGQKTEKGNALKTLSFAEAVASCLGKKRYEAQ